MSWYLEALKKYAVFSGRARRMEFWYFVLFNLIVAIVLSLIDRLIGTFYAGSNIGLLSGIYSLAVLIPTIAVTVRRLLLINPVPLIGSIVLLVFELLPGTPGSNRFGPDPRAATGEARVV